MSDLLPCPFCGGSAMLCVPDLGKPYVACERNFCSGPKSTTAMAIGAWNNRAPAEAALSAARAEGRREGLLEAAGIAEHGSFAFDIEVWLTATKKEMTAKVALAIAEAIRAAAEVSP